jgi:iron complex transport system ATP-binding protein
MIQPGFTAQEIVASGKGAVINPWHEAAPADAAHTLDLLADADLSAIADRPWELLSQGERQRVLICRALMANPRLLILDEPCSGLDPVARRRFLEYLEQTAARPDDPPMVLVTHHVEEITPAFTHALVLKQGRVLASGPLDQVMRADLLSDAFGETLGLERSPTGRWRLVEE